ncbi:unnamed protein product [Effrenium voratum]|nr:unnamed protein product [Effrenium voratum]
MAKPQWLVALVGVAALFAASRPLQFVAPSSSLGSLRGASIHSRPSQRPEAPQTCASASVLCTAALLLVAGKAQRSARNAIPKPHTVPVVNLEGKKIGEEELQFQVYNPFTANYVVHQAITIWKYQQLPFTEFHKRRSDMKKGKKLWKNKGVGKARMGSIYSPLFGKSSTNKNPHGLDNKRKKKLVRHHHMKSISTVLQSKWRCMKIVDGLEDIKESRYYELCNMLRGWCGIKSGIRQTLMISRNGYGEEHSHRCVPMRFSYRSPLYMAGRLIDNFSMRRPRDMDPDSDGLYQALLGRKIIVSREAFFDLKAKFDAFDGWAFKTPNDILVEQMQKLMKEYPYDRTAEFEAAREVPRKLAEREFWAKEIREKDAEAALS